MLRLRETRTLRSMTDGIETCNLHCMKQRGISYNNNRAVSFRYQSTRSKKTMPWCSNMLLTELWQSNAYQRTLHTATPDDSFYSGTCSTILSLQGTVTLFFTYLTHFWLHFGSAFSIHIQPACPECISFSSVIFHGLQLFYAQQPWPRVLYSISLTLLQAHVSGNNSPSRILLMAIQAAGTQAFNGTLARWA